MKKPAQVYRGWRDQQGNAQVRADFQLLDLRLDLDNHSPTGFEWGYAGSGPAQLALAILADALEDNDKAIALHQRFKFRIISKLHRDKSWTLPREYVLAVANTIEEDLRYGPLQMKKLPTGKVVTGTGEWLQLTDGRIQKGRSYILPATEDEKTIGKWGKVVNIQMVLMRGDKISFWVRLEDSSGQGWRFEYKPE
jgi:Family of unknown function (DUF6166)